LESALAFLFPLAQAVLACLALLVPLPPPASQLLVGPLLLPANPEPVVPAPLVLLVVQATLVLVAPRTLLVLRVPLVLRATLLAAPKELQVVRVLLVLRATLSPVVPRGPRVPLVLRVTLVPVVVWGLSTLLAPLALRVTLVLVPKVLLAPLLGLVLLVLRGTLAAVVHRVLMVAQFVFLARLVVWVLSVQLVEVALVCQAQKRIDLRRRQKYFSGVSLAQSLSCWD